MTRNCTNEVHVISVIHSYTQNIMQGKCDAYVVYKLNYLTTHTQLIEYRSQSVSLNPLSLFALSPDQQTGFRKVKDRLANTKDGM